MNQSYAYNPQNWLSALAVLFLLTLAFEAFRHRRVAGALPFAIACLFASLWAAGSVMEYSAVDIATKIFWFKFQVLFQLPATTAVTCFVLEYAWPGRWLTRRNLALLAITPLLVLVLTLTNDLNHLVWLSFGFDGTLIAPLGPAGQAFIAYAFGLGVVNLIVFAWLFLHSPQHRWPVAIMAVGQVIVRVLYVLEVAQVVRSELPLEIIGIAFTYLMYIIALFGFRLFDPIPLAMQMVITQMHDGMVVLDLQGRVTNLNPAAQTILATSTKQGLGQPLKAILPGYADLIADPLAAGIAPTEILLGTNSEPRYYMLETSAIQDWRGAELGHLLLLRDITNQKQAQAKIVEQQRAVATLQERWRLARDLHDSLGQVIAFVNAQGQAVRQHLSRGDLSNADAKLARLVEAAREADVDVRESILGLRVTFSEHGLIPALSQYLAQYEKNYAIQTKLIKPDVFQEHNLDPLVETQLLAILQEALSNIRKHADAKYVVVKFEMELDLLNVSVEDDGRGFDPGASTKETGEHIGLRVMRERAEEIGGSLNVSSEPGQGTQVMVRVPLKSGKQID